MPHFICTLQHKFYCNLFVCFHICVWKGNQMSGFALHTPVLTSDNIIRSLMANVSPCFIFILFLSKHFIAYLKTTWKQWFYFFISLYNNHTFIDYVTFINNSIQVKYSAYKDLHKDWSVQQKKRIYGCLQLIMLFQYLHFSQDKVKF